MTENKKLSSPEERLSALEERINEQDKTIASQKDTIKELSERLTSASEPEKEPEPPKIPDKTFEVNKVKYKFRVAQFSYKGKTMTALDALTDKELLKELVEKQSGVIRVIE